GAIGYDSRPGEGAQFFFTLPVSGTAAAPAAVRNDGEGPRSAPANLTLLMFLRSPPVGEVLADLVEPFGSRVVRATSMAEAVERASKERFDAIIAGAGD